jgi:hypothetical protein
MASPDIPTSLPPLDDLHRRVRAAYVARDLKSYMDFFSSDLRYHQVDGRTIGRDQLTRDVESQFGSVSAVDAASRTDRIETDPEGVVETVTQWGWIATSAFGSHIDFGAWNDADATGGGKRRMAGR